jgi:hypothetical protein
MATLPDGNVITITASGTLSGNKSIQVVMKLRDRHTSTTQSLTGTLSDVGNLKLDLDVQEDSDNINDFVYNCAEFSFSMFSTFGDGTSFGPFLNDLLLTDLIQVEVTYGGFNKDVFLALKTDVSYDELKRTFAVKCFTPFKFTNQVTEYATASSKLISLSYNDGTVYNYTGITCRDLLDSYLKTIGASTSVNKIQSSFTKTATDVLDTSGGSSDVFHMFVQSKGVHSSLPTLILDTTNRFLADTFERARSIILKLGIVESAIIGSLFGENFYVRRDYNGSDTDYKADITSSDLEDFKIKFNSPNIKSISILANNIGSSESSTAIATVDVSATKLMDVNIGLFANTQKLNDTTPQAATVTDPRGLYDESDAGLTLGDNAIAIYKKIFGVGTSTLFSFTVLGTEKIKPYQYIELDTAISDFVDSNNNKIRPSSIEYDLKSNKIKVEAYSIN